MDETARMEPMGPIEFVLLEFPKRSFDGEIAKALADLADRQIVSIFDLLLVSKDDDGSLEVVELVDAEPTIAERFAEVSGEVMWLLSKDDIAEAAGSLQPNTTGILVVWENTWARHLSSAVARAGGQVVIRDRLDSDAVAASMASSPGSQ
ncbi:MAG TPA: DUF6325 family protein [Acidimicrobiia bacterium]|nr:DUF6325 family protein [Acidimicrobiia bacterium]